MNPPNPKLIRVKKPPVDAQRPLIAALDVLIELYPEHAEKKVMAVKRAKREMAMQK